MLGEVGTEPGQFNYPRAIDAGSGAIVVIDKSARVQRIDPQTGACLGWTTMPRFEHGKPTGISVAPFLDGSSTFYIADTHEHRVLVIDPPMGSGDPPIIRAAFGSLGTGAGEFIFPTDIAVLTDDGGHPQRIYVSEYGGNDRISVFGPGALHGEEAFLFSFGTPGSGEGAELNRPQSIAIDPDTRELVVTDAVNHRIGRFTLDGDLVSWIGSPDESGTGRFDYPYGLWIMGGSRAIVSEFGSSRVSVVDLRAGEVVARYGKPGRDARELATPWGVAGLGGALYVLDSGNNRVVACVPSGLSSEDLSLPKGGS